jgi:hypothetical protein
MFRDIGIKNPCESGREPTKSQRIGPKRLEGMSGSEQNCRRLLSYLWIASLLLRPAESLIDPASHSSGFRLMCGKSVERQVELEDIDSPLAKDAEKPVLGHIGDQGAVHLPSSNARAAVSEGEIVVASNEELHAARLSGKRLLALWNALPDVEKRRNVGDRGALIDQLWLAIEALPDPQSDAKRPSKQDAVIAMLRRAEGATVDEVASATGWQRHTVRGVFSMASRPGGR